METLEDRINFFFRPSTEAPTGGVYSTLYLLRRDIFTCFGYDPNSMNPILYQALWPGVMCILAGIDLLGKYLEGDDIKTTVTYRFKKYYERYFDHKDDFEVIYQLRNSMLHSFGLYAFDSKNKVKIKEYFFVLDRRNDNILVIKNQPNVYNINIIALCNAFELSINKYLQHLRNDDHLQKNFEKMFPFYTGIRMQEI